MKKEFIDLLLLESLNKFKEDFLDILLVKNLENKEQKSTQEEITYLKPHAPPHSDSTIPPFSSKWTYKKFIDAQQGDIYHAVLARIKTMPENLSGDLKKICSELLGLQDIPYNIEDIVKTLTNFLNAASVSLFLKPGLDTEIFNEKEFTDRYGNLFRMDRVMVTPEEVWVVDFKSGTESGNYHAQIKNYIKILEELYPGRNIKGFLAYIREAKVEQVV